MVSLDFRLSSQVLRRLYGSVQGLNGQEGGQIGGVRRDHDHSEEIPHAGKDPNNTKIGDVL